MFIIDKHVCGKDLSDEPTCVVEKRYINHCDYLTMTLKITTYLDKFKISFREDVKIPTYNPHTNHKRSSVRSHTLALTSICDLSHSLCWSPLTDLGHINSVTYVCHPLWFICGHRKGILTSPLTGFLDINHDSSTRLPYALILKALIQY